MLIIGAKGLAKEVLEIFHQRNEIQNLFFYDDISTDLPDLLYGQFRVLRNMKEVAILFSEDNRFAIGIGKPELRLKMHNQFSEVGGVLTSAISPKANIGNYGTSIGLGTIIMAGTVITNDVKFGKGCLVNPNCTISHDSIIDDFVEISPGVQVTGNCKIGKYCTIGTNATILPNIQLGCNVTVGAGAVVTINVEDNQTVVGLPAKAIGYK